MDSKHTLLIVDDNVIFCETLAKAMIRRGYLVVTAFNSESARAQANQAQYAIVDLRIGGESGLDLVSALAKSNPDMTILILTGYASIATAVRAIKLGAIQYLTKPAEPDDILTALGLNVQEQVVEIPSMPMSVNRLEWEHLQRVLDNHDGNISAAACALGMHRRTLQRKLQKRPVKQ